MRDVMLAEVATALPRNRVAITGFIFVVIAFVIPLASLVIGAAAFGSTAGGGIAVELFSLGAMTIAIFIDLGGVALGAIGLARRRGRRATGFGLVAVIVGLVLLVSAIVIVGSLTPTLPYVNSIR